ncbi:MAG: decaprenyl-phosphate phosphoribosyltransferase [Caldisericia bacterium]|jgi:4-hydroxybenzoate polyprenyltransferase|nr:decaprenyl-phosphate phosphoribosyltransferase [Caldisericia bacterium]
MKTYFSLLRVKHWIKNLFVFAPIIFSKNLFNLELFNKTLITFFLLSLLTSGLYILNDIFDLDSDLEHPEKRNRPLPSGKVNKNFALTLSIILITLPITLSLFIDHALTIIFFIYLILNFLYSFLIKRLVIIDVFIIAINFILRIFSGSVVTKITVSNWLILCTLFLSLFLGFAKRRFEIVLLGENAHKHREVLSSYSVELLDKLIVILSTATILSYSLYSVSTETKEKFGEGFIFTIPIVLYGILRYFYLIYEKKEGEPIKLVTEDLPLILTILIWIIFSIFIIYK